MDSENLIAKLIKEFGVICMNTDPKLPFYEIRWNDNIIHIHHCYWSEDKVRYVKLCVSESLLLVEYITKTETNSRTNVTSTSKQYIYKKGDKNDLICLPAFKLSNNDDFIIRIKPFLVHSIFLGKNTISTSHIPCNSLLYQHPIDKINLIFRSSRAWTERENDQVDKVLESIYRYIKSDLITNANR